MTTTTTRNATTTTTRQQLPQSLAEFLTYVMTAAVCFGNGFLRNVLGRTYIVNPMPTRDILPTATAIMEPTYQYLSHEFCGPMPSTAPPADANRDGYADPLPTVVVRPYVGTMRLDVPCDVPTDAPAPARKSRAPRKTPTRKGNGPTVQVSEPAPAPTDDGLDALSMPQLRSICQAENVKPARTKAETAARIRANRQNETTATPSEPAPARKSRARKAK